MAKRGRPERDDNLHPITVLVPQDVKSALEAAAKVENVPFSQMARRWLSQQMAQQSSAWAEVEPRLTPKARAVGRLVGFLANELEAYSPSGEQAEYLQQGITRLLERLSGKGGVAGPKNDAAMMVDYWLLRMSNAHESSHEAGAASPFPAEQRALLEIRKDIARRETGGPEKVPDKRTPGKERK